MEEGFQEFPIFDASDLKIGMVVSRQNYTVAQNLLRFAKDALFEYNIGSLDSDIVFVAGPMEVPYALQRMASSGNYDCLVVIGCILIDSPRGSIEIDTLRESVLQLTFQYKLPIGFGVVVARREKDAVNQLYFAAEAAAGALELANLESRAQSKKAAAPKKKATVKKTTLKRGMIFDSDDSTRPTEEEPVE
ncbi:MAG TPA: 6,7-dimethyl-8-ribityllumazine synthase [Patescibacteria group bacterium]|nr:6,7-dimethyl-8-ribityllumazine synthase [Patescibacteria group bacterium]